MPGRALPARLHPLCQAMPFVPGYTLSARPCPSCQATPFVPCHTLCARPHPLCQATPYVPCYTLSARPRPSCSPAVPPCSATRCPPSTGGALPLASQASMQAKHAARQQQQAPNLVGFQKASALHRPHTTLGRGRAHEAPSRGAGSAGVSSPWISTGRPTGATAAAPARPKVGQVGGSSSSAVAEAAAAAEARAAAASRSAGPAGGPLSRAAQIQVGWLSETARVRACVVIRTKGD